MSHDVNGRCPACGAQSLFLADGGYITCRRVDCPNPDAASDILEAASPHHIVKIEASSFSVQHPLVERLGGELFDCGLHQWLSSLGGPPHVPGTYQVIGVPDWARAVFNPLPIDRRASS